MCYQPVPRSQEELESIKAAINRQTEKLIAAGPEACRQYLIDLGIYNADGTLHKNYGGQ